MEMASDSQPDWLKVRIRQGQNYAEVEELMQRLSLHTVCEEAYCPNMGECFENRTATFLILGRVCTRNCLFCAIESGRPGETDREEPEKVAQAAALLKLNHVVVTSVTRDDLADGGAAVFAKTVTRIRKALPNCSVELLVPDFLGCVRFPSRMSGVRTSSPAP